MNSSFGKLGISSLISSTAEGSYQNLVRGVNVRERQLFSDW